MSKHEVHMLNGPNLNLLGAREPEIYGHETLGDIEDACTKHATELNARLIFRQSNHEGALIDWVQEAGAKGDALVLNAAGFTHTSVALHDALKAIAIPTIELHLSNIYAREAFRHKSLLSSVVNAMICGFGADGYIMALDAAMRLIEKNSGASPQPHK